MDHAIEDVGVEPEGLPSMAILLMVLGIVVALGVVVQVAIGISAAEFRDAEVTAIETTGYPLLRETRASAQELLTQAGRAADGTVRIPIEAAMQQIVAEGASGSTGEITLRR